MQSEIIACNKKKVNYFNNILYLNSTNEIKSTVCISIKCIDIKATYSKYFIRSAIS